ncbi:MAG TPA: AtpZ/AtpI family protein [Polyangiaceae bacterium]|nr:AtpZ/AtpI family protein [Polyangiaceae bacterium]
MQQHWKSLGGPGTLGLEIALSVALGLFGGQWLDKKFGTAPWLTWIGLAYGLAAATRAIYRALKQSKRELEELDREEQRAREKFNDEKPSHKR